MELLKLEVSVSELELELGIQFLLLGNFVVPLLHILKVILEWLELLLSRRSFFLKSKRAIIFFETQFIDKFLMLLLLKIDILVDLHRFLEEFDLSIYFRLQIFPVCEGVVVLGEGPEDFLHAGIQEWMPVEEKVQRNEVEGDKVNVQTSDLLCLDTNTHEVKEGKIVPELFKFHEHWNSVSDILTSDIVLGTRVALETIREVPRTD